MSLCGLIGIALAMPLFSHQVTGFVPTLFGYPLLACSATLLIAAASSNRWLVGRRAIPGARALAIGSCSLYLIHKMVYHRVALWADHWPQRLQPYALEAGLLAAFAGGSVYWVVERPFLKLRERLNAARATRRQLIPQPR